MARANVHFFVMVLGNTMDSHKTFLDDLKLLSNLREVYSVNSSDVIIAFVPVVSRAGTDISAAMSKIPEGKPVVLVVLHHTLDEYYIAPDSRRCVNKDNVFAVDCLFHEDQGLLRCLRNDDAVRAVKDHLIPVAHSQYLKMHLSFYRWILLAVVICLGTGVGFGLSAGVGSAVGNDSCSVVVVVSGIVVSNVLIISMTVIWVKYYYESHANCHLPHS